MEILATIFGSKERLRIIRYAITHEKENFEVGDVAATLALDTVLVRKELKLLTKATLVKELSFNKELSKKGANGKPLKKKVNGFTLNKNFVYLPNFKSLLLDKEELAPTEIYEHFRKLGKIELFILTGIFQGKVSREVDILIAGKNLKRSKIEEKIEEIEGLLGAEVRYAVFDSEELMYRYMMYDRFIREVLHSEHIAVVKELRFS